MKTPLIISSTCCALVAFVYVARAQFDPNDWPPTKDPAKKVHYVVTDGGLTAPSENWSEGVLAIQSGGDQVTEDFAIGGHVGKKTIGNYLNVADQLYAEWADIETIDILVQVYGDAALYNAQGNPRNFAFLIGALPDVSAPNGGQIPPGAKNKQWNWVLFSIPNAVNPNNGLRYVGNGPAPGGVNGGTIRFQGVPNLIVRVIAFGEGGAFGTKEDINRFNPPLPCPAEPNSNLVGIDINAGTANHLQVLNAHDHTVTFQDNVGPAGDQRRAVVPDGVYLNFGITDNYLGLPCNDPRAMKVCVEFYDDPAFAGQNVRFGPEAYATDDTSGVGFFPAEKRAVLAGSGVWVRRSWTVPAVNLRGINADAFTAGPRFYSGNGQVAVSRFDMAILRTGTHPLAGQDPLADCVQDQNICTGAYGDYAELDLAKGLEDGLRVGTSAGDQNMMVEEAGPAEDRRLAVRSDLGNIYLNFAITDQKLGPTSQDPALLAICATYYDDPDLVGRQFKPEVYDSEVGGVGGYAFTPPSDNVRIEGTGKWRRAYWEISGMKFSGVNQGPQAAARFWENGQVFITRLRYAVIRPCGPNAGVNKLEGCKPFALQAKKNGAQVEISWPGVAEPGWTLQETSAFETPTVWTDVAATPVLENNRYVVKLTPTDAKFYRMVQ
jgi:hypothetical protein